jgi:benzaldehyde dehydrogenase (NAD)
MLTNSLRQSTRDRESLEQDFETLNVIERVRANQQNLTADLKRHYDFIVCGSGSSGSVVARRLAENPDVSVLLLEAGGTDDVPNVMEAIQWSTNLGSERDWGFVDRPNPRLNRRSIPLNMGKVLGGGSSVNVMAWSRGHKNDWDFFAFEAGDPAAHFEVAGTKAMFDQSADDATQPSRKVLKDDADILSYIERVPLGVVGVIGPFNFPLSLALRSVAAALAMGNAVVLKPSLNTAVSGAVIIARVLEEAGLPEGVLQVLPAGDEAGAAIVDDPNISMIAFTGSTSVGRQIASNAGRTLKRVALELGGKNPLLVLSDADLEAAARAGAFGTFLHQGQVCLAVGIHLVHKALIDRYAARVAELAKAIKVGDPYLEQVGLGPVINEKQRNHIYSIVEEAIQAGAELVEGGTFEGLFYRPTVLKNVPQNTRAFKEELFGPVAVIVPFEVESEAIRLANGTGYGLSAAVFGELEHARQVGAQIESGMVHLNDMTIMGDPMVPFGGTKASGNASRIGGDASIEECSTWRWDTETRQPKPYEIPSM